MRLVFALLLLLASGCMNARIPLELSASFDLQGHRGARGLLPENTIPGFLRALDLGVTTLEMDAVITADGQVVLSHEPWFSADFCAHPDGRPVTPREAETLLIYRMTYGQVEAYDCGSRGHPRFPEQEAMRVSKPLLRDVIREAEAYARRTARPLPRYNVETKSRPAWDGERHPDPATFARLVLGVLREMEVLERSTLQSFDLRTLQAAREMEPDLSLALLVEWRQGANLDRQLGALGFTPSIYSPDYRLVNAALVRDAHRRGMQVIPWTVNDVRSMRRLMGFGVDGLITDYPDRWKLAR